MNPRSGRARWGWFAGGLATGILAGSGVFFLATELWASDDPETVSPPRFVEETSSSGIRHAYDGEFVFFVGGGVAVFDCNDDGKPDLYFAGGTNPAGLFRNESPVGGALRFSPVSDPVTDLTGVAGAYPLDIDGDGLIDIAVLRVGENVLLRGRGDCRFERANEQLLLEGGREWTAAFSATWEGSASLPTLAFGNYLNIPKAGEPARTCAPSELLRPAADGREYGPPTELSPGLCTLSVLFGDWNASGRRDLRMTNDRHYYLEGGEQLWRIEEGEPPRLYSDADGWEAMQIWGMGIATQDLTGDELPEVFLTSQGDNKLQTLVEGPSRPTYGDIAIRRGVTAHRPFVGDEVQPSTAWHPEFQDVNNDGLVDLFISKGNVEAQADYAADDPSNLLLGNPDGTFTESARSAGILSLGRGRGAALADFNLDGMLDLVEVNRRENVRLWRNVGFGIDTDPEPMGNWIALRLAQPGANRDAIGAWIEVRTGDGTTRRELTIGGGHAGGQLGWIHFGLATADGAEVRVRWPDGEIGPWVDVERNRFSIIERGASEARIWVPPEEGRREVQ